MTTMWGAGRGSGGSRRGDRWEAPRLAYELAAAFVEEPVASGGGGGPSFPEPAAKRWADLDDAGRRDVVIALGAQARVAVGELERMRRGNEALPALQIALQHASRCPRACERCAVSLCRIEVAAWLGAGFAPAQIAAALAAASGVGAGR